MADVAQGERRQLAPPVDHTGAFGWLRKNLFSSWGNALTTIVLVGAIGFQDIVSIANTTLNQTGQAIEAIALIMLVFLTISLSISLFMNWYNARIALSER